MKKLSHLIKYNLFESKDIRKKIEPPILEYVDVDQEEDARKRVEDWMNRKKDYPELIFGKLYLNKNKKSEWWEYIGDSNSPEWSKNGQILFNNQSYRPMEDNELEQISDWLRPVLSPLAHDKGMNPITKRHQDWVCYPTKRDVSNSRFENCWFLMRGKDRWGFESGWDMCVQGFSDEWYLINVGSGDGRHSYWFRVDTLEGLHNFIDENFIKTYEEFKTYLQDLKTYKLFEFVETEKNTPTLYKDENLEVKVVKTFDATKKQNTNTYWCSSDKDSFYGHNKTANMFRINFKDGYKLRLTWDYIEREASELVDYSGGTHWGQGGKVDGRNKQEDYDVFRPVDNDDTFYIDWKSTKKREIVGRIKSIPEDAKLAMMEYHEKMTKEKSAQISKSYKEIELIKVIGVTTGSRVYDYSVTLDYRGKEYKVQLSKSGYCSLGKLENDFKNRYAFIGNVFPQYLLDKTKEFIKKNNIKDVERKEEGEETNESLIVEKFDDNIRIELKRLGINDPDEINKYLYDSHRGHLGEYLNTKGKSITFGLLNAIFKDAIKAKKVTDMRVGVIKMFHRIVPMAMAPFFPILAIIGYIFGASRAFNKIIIPILSDPGHEYSAFLKKVIDGSMRVAEGEIHLKDRFSRAFVVSDRLVDAVKPEILHKFSLELSKKMGEIDPDLEVPDYYIENELKSYLNKNYGIVPEISLRK